MARGVRALVACADCGAQILLEESDVIFADSIGRKATDCAWLCDECWRENDDDG